MSQYNKPTSGKIYSSLAGVIATAGDRIADYEGAAAMNIAVDSIVAFGQNFWPQEYALNQMLLSLNYGGVYLQQATFNTVLGVTAVQGSVMNDATPTATLYKFTTALESIPAPEYLSHIVRSSDSKIMQIWGAAGRLSSDFNMALTKDAFITHEIGIGLFADANGDVLWFIQEN